MSYLPSDKDTIYVGGSKIVRDTQTQIETETAAKFKITSRLVSHYTNPLEVGTHEFLSFYKQTTPGNWELVYVDVPAIPVGTILALAFDNDLLSGFLPCKGAIYRISDYPKLYGVIDQTWGGTLLSGGSYDPTTHFRVPDLRRRTLIGSGGTGTSVIGSTVGDTGGAEQHTLTINEMPNHGNHFNQTGTFTAVKNEDSYAAMVGSGFSIGGSNPHNIMQPSAVVSYSIKV
jgi:microcystin-dependent protein